MYVSTINLSSSTQADTPEDQVKFWSTTHMNAVYSPDPTTENYTFCNATPSASLKQRVLGPSKYKVGVTYRLLFAKKHETAKTQEDDLMCFAVIPGDFRDGNDIEVKLGTWKRRKTTKESDPVNIIYHKSGEDNEEVANEWTEICMRITNKDVFDFFVPGQLYRVGIMPLTATEK